MNLFEEIKGKVKATAAFAKRKTRPIAALAVAGCVATMLNSCAATSTSTVYMYQDPKTGMWVRKTVRYSSNDESKAAERYSNIILRGANFVYKCSQGR
ncbi:MAG: hypothetical protein IKJ28_02015 [Alphaproteobacteria bacterium]|nr:hypothetical protein [Alphaproteobacteria bacterium]